MLTLNQWLGLGWALPGPHKSFIRLHGSFLWLCWGIHSWLRCSRETSQSLPRLLLSLSEVAWACNTAFGYKPKGAGTQSRTLSCTQIHHQKRHSYAHKSEHSQRQRHTRIDSKTHTRIPQHTPLLLSPLRFIYNPLAAVQGPGAITHGT